MDEIAEYEESHMTRLSMSKAESKSRRKDEEEVALGGGASLDTGNRKGVRGRGGFGGEFDELLSVIERGNGKKSGVMGRTGGSEYEALRQMRKERSAVPAEHEGANVRGGAAGKKRKGKFDQAVDKNRKKSRKG